MESTKRIAALVLTCGLVLVTGTAWGQIVYGQPASARLRMVYTSWETTVDGQKYTLNQVTTPFQTYLPLRENLEARLFIAGISNSLEGQGEDFKLAGLTDLRLQVNRSFSDDRFLLSLGANMPTGKTSLNYDEDWVVMNFLSNDFLVYPNRRLGGGLGLNAMFGVATLLGEYRFGASVTYQYTGKYEAYQDSGDYNPGDFASVNVGLQRRLERMTWTGDLTATTYGDDKKDGNAIYNRGNQLAARLGGTYERADFRLACSARYFVRDRNAIYDATGALDYQLQMYGNEFDVAANISWFSDGRKWEYGPLVDLRLIAANEFDLGSSYSLGVGGEIKHWLSTGYKLGLSGEYFTGNADGGSIDLKGYQITTALSGGF